MKILLVEDDDIFSSRLATTLADHNYTVEVVTDGEAGWDYAQATDYDIIVLDWDLPRLDGRSLCQRLRQANYAGAILLLTSKGDETSKVAGLDAGADDYVVKPCPPAELVARLRALLRRPREMTDPILHWGTLQLDPNTCQVTFAHQSLNLSPKEYGLLELFLRHPQRIFSSTALIERLWTFEETPGDETVRTHIKRLRRKLKRAGAADVIENIYGMGYRLKPPPDADPAEAVAGSEGGADAPPEPPLPPETAARAAALAALGKFRGILVERLTHLEDAAIALQTGSPLPETLRQMAQQSAHKLAGSLGMFGLMTESDQCKALEAQLAAPLGEPQAIITTIRQVQRDLRAIVPLSPPDPAEVEAPAPVVATAALIAPVVAPPPPLWVITANPTLAAGMQALAPPHQTVAIAASWTEAKAALSHQNPPLLLDLAPTEDWTALGDWLAAYAQEHTNTLWLLPPPEGDLLDLRLVLSPYPHCVFLAPALSPEQIWAEVLTALTPPPPLRPQILAVDDDPLVLKQISQQLSALGMVVTALTDPRQFWATLNQTKPDLLILDIEMPHLEGVELCRMVRRDRQWAQLPILFLTSRQDTDSLQQVYAAGADDYITKPCSQGYLGIRILNRLQRQQTTYLPRGPVIPGGLPAPQTLQALQRDLSLAQRHRQSYCLAVLKFWHPQVPVTPAATQEMVKLLRGNLRKEDLLLQLAADTLLLGLYGLQAAQAQDRLDRLAADLISGDPRQNPSDQVKIYTGYAIAPEEGTTPQGLWHLAIEKLRHRVDYQNLSVSSP
ncbi:MAG: response regulator [Leptolyngbya sp.]|nr:response regulator [Leptolyngbya sp.]